MKTSLLAAIAASLSVALASAPSAAQDAPSQGQPGQKEGGSGGGQQLLQLGGTNRRQHALRNNERGRGENQPVNRRREAGRTLRGMHSVVTGALARDKRAMKCLPPLPSSCSYCAVPPP